MGSFNLQSINQMCKTYTCNSLTLQQCLSIVLPWNTSVSRSE